MNERIAEYEAEAIKLRQHISKVDHQNAQLNEVILWWFSKVDHQNA